MAAAVYLLGAGVTLLCALLLLKHYSQVHSRLLLWAGLCFVCLAASNGLLFVDAIILPDVSLYRLRLLFTASGMALMLYGLIWESDAS
jgi:hypothetical protein